jgi:xanthine/CO dehydrogenase XdhC/CoxF family maturation factor
MRDLQKILLRTRELDAAHTPYVIATVVQVEGSAYRGPGTRMLVEAVDRSLGTISGGCLEADVREQAAQVLKDDQPRLLYYDSTSEDDILWGTGLGCNGSVRVFLERLPATSGPHVPDLLSACVFDEKSIALATIFATEGDTSARPGQHLLTKDDLCTAGDIADAELSEKVSAALGEEFTALDITRRSAGKTRHYQLSAAKASVLLETLLPPVQIFIFGAGYDAEPVARLAAELGWTVSVVDHRPSYARAERFPDAHNVILAAPGSWPQELVFDERTVALVMTHSYLQDQVVLKELLPKPLAYLGVLGPRQRTRRLLDELQAEGVALDTDRFFFSPVGLDIGAETAEEIALSILAEAQAVLAGRRGGPLRERQEPIHDRPQ